MNKKAKKKNKTKWLQRMVLTMAVLVLLFLILGILTLAALIGKTIEEQLKATQGSFVTQAVEHISEKDEMQDYEHGDSTISGNGELSDEEKVRERIRSFAQEHHLSVRDYPEPLIECLVGNPEKEAFVLNYPLKKSTYSNKNLDAYLGQSQVPLFLQWDSRWGYYVYGSSVMGVTGCGPTCLSMVALHLLQDETLTPVYMADFAEENGYYIEDVGTDWSFMTDGAKRLGLKVQEVSLTERIVKRHLQQGRPIICAMRAGDFTETGHFIVLVGVEDGKIRVNDPNSEIRSERLWEFEELQNQIKNMWAYSVR